MRTFARASGLLLVVVLAATACTKVKFPNSGWQEGRRTCGDECPGRVAWLQRLGGPAADAARAVGLLPHGRLLVTGYYLGPATRDAGAPPPREDAPPPPNPPPAPAEFAPACPEGSFLARLTDAGAFEWTACAAEADAYGLAVLPDEGAYVTGDFENTAVFGKDEPGAAELTAVGRYDMFLARYDAQGKLAWVRSAGGDGRTHGAVVALLPDGGAAVSGSFGRTAVFGRGEASELELASDHNDGIFLAKYAADGALVWARGIPATRTDEGSGLLALPDGSLVMAGHLGGTVMFDLVTLQGEGTSDAYVAKLDPAGSVVWAVRYGGSGTDSADALALLPEGDLLVAGHFEHTAVFGAGTPAEVRLESVGDADAFLARLAPDGTLRWVKSVGGPGFDAGFALAVDEDAGFVLAGSFEDTARFGAGDPMETVLTGAGDADLFVARYNADAVLQWVTMAGGASYEAVRGIALGPDGEVYAAGSFGFTAAFGPGEPGEARLTAVEDERWAQDASQVSDAFLLRLDP